MVKKEGKFPCNARVDVDYTEKKPKIKFGYTSKNPKQDAIKQTIPLPIFLLIAFILLIPVIPYFFTSYSHSYPSNCDTNITLDKLNMTVLIQHNSVLSNYSSQSIFGFNLTCDNQTHYMRWINEDVGTPYFSGYTINKKYLAYLIFIVIWVLLVPFLSIVICKKFISPKLIKSKWFQKNIPRIQAEGWFFKRRYKKYRKFKPKDVLENVIVIPYFSNIELDYKTSGDFNKQLEKIKIREYKTRKINVKSNKKGKLKTDNFKWYAIFYFKDKPKDGYMEVIYQ